MSTGAILSGGLGTFGIVATILTDGLSTASGLPQPPLGGTQYEDQTVIYSGSGFSLQQGAVPAVAYGDVLITPTMAAPGNYVFQVNSDGTIEVFSGGDTSRQSFPYSRYDISANFVDGPATCWINDVQPVWTSVVNLQNVSPNVPMTTINMASSQYVTSPEGDTMTFALASGALPPGLSLSSAGILSGTPTTVGPYQFTVSATDYAGLSTVSGVNFITIAVQALNTPAAIVTWENNALNLVGWFSGSYVLYNGVAPGTFGKYVGMTITSSGSVYQLNALDMDYKLRARWN